MMAFRGIRIVGMCAFLNTAFLMESLLDAQVASPATNGHSSVWTDYFSTSELCSRCHSSARSAKALKDATGRAVGPHDLWQTSMMARSSVDPFWRAVVAVEVAATPSRKKEIEAKCLRCHAPMASVEAEFADTIPSRATFLHGTSTLARLATDGVSCALCHQIPAGDSGNNESFSGHFRINEMGHVFGPRSRPFYMPMYRHTGYMATESTHVRESSLCCHSDGKGITRRG